MLSEQVLLKLNQIDLLLDSRHLLEKVSLDLCEEEILTIIGPNGAGKTTLLRVAMGLQQPTSGDVFLRPDLRIGYLPQKLNLDPTFPLTVRRFLAMASHKDPALAAGVGEALEEVGVSYVIDSPLQRLSGGEFQRVLLARALIRRPELLVLDEPLQGVDAHGQLELYQLISRIRDRHHCAILMVSHDLHLVMASTDRVLCLNRHVCCSGSPEAVTNDPAFQELFSPQTIGHLAIYSHDKTHVHKDCAEYRETDDVR
jgi:zinc transport system ATP-binding protein